MNLSSLSALSPLDGRYAARMAALRPLLSEFGLMHRRVQVEVEWLIALSDAGMPQLPALSEAARGMLRSLVVRFSEADAQAIKDIERTTNHDVKAVEYWIKGRFEQHAELRAASEFVHFACTSEDINNTSHALMIKAARDQVLQPALERVIGQLRALAARHAALPMLSRTHGQTASPTTVGKEIANVVARLATARARIAAVQPLAKMNGAVGNYNAHLAAWPDFDWESFGRRVVEQQLGLAFNPYTIQIEPHDWMAELFDAMARANTILIDWSRDVWGYISLGYFRQAAREGEVGSSTMPHKVNPIDFENAEGNYGLANALLGHDSMSRGLDKIEVDAGALAADLDDAWEVLAEPVQTVMRRWGLPEPYERLKALTRGKPITREVLREFIATLELPESERDRLLALTPAGYVGKAAELAARVGGAKEPRR